MVDTATFLDHLRRSGLIETDFLEEALEQIEAEAGEHGIKNADYLAQALVNRYLLTEWQLRQLKKGRYKGFFLRQYKILGHLGTGGMSTVYLAEHTVMQRRVAIKVLPKKRLEKEIYLQRFIREAQAIATLDHPNIIRAYDIDQEGDVHYIVMEYFNGINLQQLLDREKSLPFERIVRILRQAAIALEHAHGIGVVHRDIKPGNLLVDEWNNVKLLDLGLALLDERLFEGRISSIQEDTILGTADYLAPEQAIDSHRVDARADIYGLGGVLYFCLTGHPPFPEGSVSKRLLAHQQTEPRSILVSRPDAPHDLVLLCRRMMSKNPRDRQQTAAEVVRDMEHWLIDNRYAVPSEFVRPMGEDSLKEDHDAAGNAEEPLNSHGKLLSLMKQLEEADKEPLNEKGPQPHESDFSVLGGEVSINLFDTGASSGLRAIGDDSEKDQQLFKEMREKAKAEAEGGDPILIALNEIERTRRRTRYGTANSATVVPALRRSQTMPKLPSSPQHSQPTPASPPNEAVSSPAPNTPSEPAVPLPAWYRLVPVWFWSLFAASVFTAVFLAGVLAALLAMMSAAAPE